MSSATTSKEAVPAAAPAAVASVAATTTLRRSPFKSWRSRMDSELSFVAVCGEVVLLVNFKIIPSVSVWS